MDGHVYIHLGGRTPGTNYHRGDRTDAPTPPSQTITERLGQYKQPVAFGFTQLFTDKGALAHAMVPSAGSPEGMYMYVCMCI